MIEKDLSLFINFSGGWVIPGVAICDTIQFVHSDVHIPTICIMGLAASMRSFILARGNYQMSSIPSLGANDLSLLEGCSQVQRCVVSRIWH